jgi:outer membrane protein OmpA-like peptidoglycan-associated protein
MKILLPISILILSCFNCLGQNLSIEFIPKYSIASMLPNDNQLVQGNSFINPRIVVQNNSSLINTNGEIISGEQNSNGWGIDFALKYKSKKQNSFSTIFGFYQQKNLLVFDIPQFQFKGVPIISPTQYIKQSGINAGIKAQIKAGRLSGIFFQLNALYNINLNEFDFFQNKWIALDISPQTFIENGTGYSVEITKINKNILAFSPEIGCYASLGGLTFEASLAYKQSINEPLYITENTYFKNKKVYGIESSIHNQKAILLNFRMPITFFKLNKNSKQPKIVTKKEPKTAPVTKNSLCGTVVDEKTFLSIPNAKIKFEGKTIFSDQNGNFRINELKIGKNFSFTIEAENYNGGKINFEMDMASECKLLNVELEPIAPKIIEKAIPKTEIIIEGKEIKKGETVVMNALQFEQGKADLMPEAKMELNKVADWLKKYPTLKIEFAGHTSNEGDFDENVRLSKERVAACKKYIADLAPGTENRIKTIGYGPTKPQVPNTSDENRRKNRRVELKIESL